MENIQSFLDDLASEQPVPGGGSVAAFQVAMGAALLAMVGRLTLKGKRYRESWERAELLLEQANTLRQRAYLLAQEDAEAYRKVADVLALPRGTDAERAERRRRMQDALKGATVPPLETMVAARQVLVLARDLVEFGNRSAVSDVGTAVLSAVAGFHAARLNVEINLAGIHDETWLVVTRARLNEQSIATLKVDTIMGRVEAIIGGEGE